jgi:hypothetical protein
MRELRLLAPSLLLLLAGCPIGSPVPLPERTRRPVDQRLIGAWTCESRSDPKPIEVHIGKSGDGITLDGRPAAPDPDKPRGSRDDPAAVTGFVASVADRSLLCVTEHPDGGDRSEPTWMAMGYRILPDGRLRLAIYDDGSPDRKAPEPRTAEEFESTLAALPDPTEQPDEDAIVCRRQR